MQFKEQTFEFPNDYDGRVVATLLSSSTNYSNRAVLYLHGYTDYFFQEHLAERFIEHGISFYALDLRKYGRSLIEGQHPNFCRSITEYYAEITASLEQIAADGNRDITLLGHSTGGLIALLYAAQGSARGLITRIVLNSPFFEFNTTPLKRNIIIPVAVILSKCFPFLHSKSELSPYYAHSVHRDYNGEWEFDTRWKPIDGFPLYFSWLAAIRKAQSELHRGLGITVPILVMCSNGSYQSQEWSDDYLSADGVLDVEHIARYSMKLGSRVELIRIYGAMHDIFLSAQSVREQAFTAMFDFIKRF